VVDLIGNGYGVKVSSKAGPVILAGLAQMVRRPRSFISQSPAGLNLAIQETKGVAVQTLPAFGAELALVTPVIVPQFANVCRTAFSVADAVDQ
jgi:hypothetical protein